jgi:hypothetical protein
MRRAVDQMKHESSPTTTLSFILEETGTCVVMGPTYSVRRDMTCLGHRRILYTTGRLGAVDMRKMQRVNRNL